MSLFAQLNNDQVLYTALSQCGALDGAPFPTKEQLCRLSGLSHSAVEKTLERFCRQKILFQTEDGHYSPVAHPIFLHYRSFRGFSQLLEYPEGTISVDLIFAGPVEADTYTAETLRVAPKDTVIRIVRLYSKDDTPFAYETYHVLYSLLRNTPKAEFQKSPVLHIVQNNLPPSTGAMAPSLIQSQYFSMVTSSEEDRHYLSLQPDSKALRIFGRAYYEGQTVSWFQIRADANQCVLKHTFNFS